MANSPFVLWIAVIVRTYYGCILLVYHLLMFMQPLCVIVICIAEVVLKHIAYYVREHYMISNNLDVSV